MPSIEPIPAFRDNYIWVVRNKQYAAAVDPGDASPLLNYLQSENLTLTAILNTHHHSDHVGGNSELRGRYSCPIYGPAKESIPCLTHPVSEGDKIFLPEIGLEFAVLEIPGHTLGHVAYYAQGILFCGDTLFGCGCGRVFEGTMEEMYDSLQKLSKLPEETRVYCAHEYTLANLRFAREAEPGNPDLIEREEKDAALRQKNLPTLPSSIELEKRTNPFLRCKNAEAFAALRIRRNQF